MEIKLINIGFGNIVMANRIVAIVSPESAPIKRIVQEAREELERIENSIDGIKQQYRDYSMGLAFRRKADKAH